MNQPKVYRQESLGPAQEAILSMIRPGARVLEIGCATGHMTRVLTEQLGCAVASIPNIAYYRIRLQLARGRFDYTDFGILDDAHLRFFTAKTERWALHSPTNS